MKRTVFEILSNNLPPEFTLEEATGALSSYYRSPQKLLESLVKQRELIRLKRGLYVLQQNFDPLTAAGFIAQPSYVSFETALAHYGLIPERVHTILSVIDGRPLKHEILGTRFIYRAQERTLFAKGMTSILIKKRQLLFATREKALFDSLAQKRLRTTGLEPQDILQFVKESFRITTESLLSLDLNRGESLASLYRNRAPTLLLAALRNKELL